MKLKLKLERILIRIIRYLYNKKWIDYTTLCNHNSDKKNIFNSKLEKLRYCEICWIVSSIVFKRDKD